MKVLVSAGEPSGDEHAAAVIAALRARSSDLSVRGMGGSSLRSSGCELLLNLEERGSHMGFSEILLSLPNIFRDLNLLTKHASTWKPDVALLVDYQDFNAQLAKRLRKLGIPVLFFIAPSVWAWRSGRAKTFQKYVDLLASIFPFEPEVFRKLGFDRCVYVGHPLHDHFSHSLLSEDEKAAFRKANGLAPERTTVALFPGSRKRELNYHLNALLEGFRLAQKEIPRLQGIVALPGSLDRTEVQARLKDDDSIRIVCGQSLSVLQVADIGALKSGTTNLQAAFAGLPFFMFYKTNLLTQLIVEFFVATKQYSIVNIIRPSTVTELIKSSFTSTRIAQEIIRLAQDTNEQSRLKQIFTEIRESFSTFEQRDELQQSTSAVDRVARLLYQLAQRP